MADYTENLCCLNFCACTKPFLITFNWLGFREVLPQSALWDTRLNSMKFLKFNDTELN